ncbi:MAG: hypothetical protein WCG83_01410 [Candidatus Peregrinibacteria bacterium]
MTVAVNDQSVILRRSAAAGKQSVILRRSAAARRLEGGHVFEYASRRPSLRCARSGLLSMTY